MKINFSKLKISLATVLILLSFSSLHAQVFEWRLVNPVYSAADPDAGGPATGSFTFTMQIHTVSGSVANVNVISTGWSYQSATAMIPASIICPQTPPAAATNVVLSSAFVTAGFSFGTVNQCATFVQMAGGKTFDRRAVGTLESSTGGITIGTTYIDVYTVTLWTVNEMPGVYIIINSGAGGSPGEFTSYSVSDAGAVEYVANSLTFTIPLEILAPDIPVTFTKFNAQCTSNGALVSWATSQEFNSSHFELERSLNGSDWKVVGRQEAAGQSAIARNYQQIDLNGGNAFYRIRQVDIDGKYTYTSIVPTRCDIKDVSYIIYPVPARDRLNVVIRSDRAMKTQLVVYDGIGQVVRKQDASIQNGNNNFWFDVSGLSSGQYILRSTDAGLKINKQFTIAH